MIASVKKILTEELESLVSKKPDQLQKQRHEKFLSIGRFLAE